MSISLAGGQVLRPHGEFETADLDIAGGLVVDAPSTESLQVDCSGYFVLPAIVDVHGDAFELELHPRPGVDIAFPIAMGSVDRQLLANGIATAFHGLTVSWEPGARSLAAGREFMHGLRSMRPRLVADHRVQLRWETFAHDAIDDIAGWLADDPRPAIAINDHTTLSMDAIKAGRQASLGKWAQRAGVTLEQYIGEIHHVAQRAPDVPDKVREIAQLAARHDAIMLSHDERNARERVEFRNLGARVCEFPLAPEAAVDAIASGEHVIMGGPNIIRGGSHTGAMSAEDAVRDGLCTVLASDYYYPSLLHAAEQLVGRGVLSLGEAWNLVSRNPAEAMRLEDRGTLEFGHRADVVVIDCSGPWRLVHTVVGGRLMSFGR